ncbi:hypothetical protein CTAYLR_004211 [Chrysophaeum taylorii]|uniref:Uncharacterized protein n=1 Tax=Chrysophaeum taylorii TaxID=2483200 RepID=A0AAD7XNK0_9STRA|nr:hypothetical protein CTAYLR_004211 [Chrysophaeum taylorii]
MRVSHEAEEEAAALAAIFGSEFRDAGGTFEVDIGSVTLVAGLPATYPVERPRISVRSRGVSERVRRELTDVAEAAVRVGDVCIFDVAEAVRARLDDAAQEAPLASTPPARHSADLSRGATVVDGEPLVDRRSTFQAFLAMGVTSESQLEWALGSLLERSKIKRATHNVRAFRFLDDRKNVIRADNDDDGEDGAGAKIAHLLEIFAVTDVLVVVSRWYGGVKLGPDRFKHVAKLTQRILEDNGYRRRGAEAAATNSKRRS